MKTQLLVLMAALALWPAQLVAQETTAAPVDAPAPTAAQPQPAAEAQPEPAAGRVEAIVRGLYVEGRVGGGYMAKNAPLELSAAQKQEFPEAPANQPLGAGSTVQMAVGYDLTDFLALQVVGGAFLVGTTSRNEPVRDLGMLFGGLGVRAGGGLSDRLQLIGSVAVTYVSADNQVEKPDVGVAILGGVGLEYFVHVRHFSVGLELSAFAPVSPMRVFVGLAPQVKYTF